MDEKELQETIRALSDYESPPHLLCAECGSIVASGPDWRWNGKSWEHRCRGASPYLGHYTPFLASPDELVEALRTAQSALAEEREARESHQNNVRALLTELSTTQSQLQEAQERIEALEGVEQAARDVVKCINAPLIGAEGAIANMIFGSLWKELEQALAQADTAQEKGDDET